MKRISINFAPQSLTRALVETSGIARVLAGIGVLLFVSAAVAAFKPFRQLNDQKLELQRLQTTLSTRVIQTPAPTKVNIPEGQASAVNAAIAQLNLPWRDVWNAIEEATPPTIAILALEPDANKHSLKGLAEAKTSDAMIAYIEQLKRQAFFRHALLNKHEINEQDANKPLRFQFEVVWAEPTQ